MPTINLHIGPTEFEFDEVVAGSEMRFSFLLEYEDPDNDGDFLPFDFTGYGFQGDIKRSVKDAVAVATFEITAPGVDGAGWVDVVLGGDVTTEIWTSGKCDFVFSIKMTPDDDDDAGITVVVGTFPVVRRATP